MPLLYDENFEWDYDEDYLVIIWYYIIYYLLNTGCFTHVDPFEMQNFGSKKIQIVLKQRRFF